MLPAPRQAKSPDRRPQLGKVACGIEAGDPHPRRRPVIRLHPGLNHRVNLRTDLHPGLNPRVNLRTDLHPVPDRRVNSTADRHPGQEMIIVPGPRTHHRGRNSVPNQGLRRSADRKASNPVNPVLFAPMPEADPFSARSPDRIRPTTALRHRKNRTALRPPTNQAVIIKDALLLPARVLPRTKADQPSDVTTAGPSARANINAKKKTTLCSHRSQSPSELPFRYVNWLKPWAKLLPKWLKN